MSWAFTLPLSFLAGVLTILSPCVLPLAPIVVAGARASDRRAPLALAAGLAATFGLVGGALASIGVDFGGSVLLRDVSAALMLAIGLALIFPALSYRLEQALAPAQNLSEFLDKKLPQAGLWGQAAMGAVLALAWAPCAGPTLGAAFVLAARGGSLGMAMLSMSVFALGAAGALLALGYGLGRLTGAGRKTALATGTGARLALGLVFAAVGLLILTGLDQRVEASALALMPDWLARIAGGL